MAVRRLSSKVPLSVGRYELSGAVGAGSLGSVYRARDGATDSLVTVQLIPADLAGPELFETLNAEFRSASQLEHPNILRVLDFGRDGEFCYLVSEWIEGITLARMIEAHARLPEETAVRIITQVGQAVDYAQSGNRCPWRVHPASILVRNDGVAKLIPFEPPVGNTFSPLLPQMIAGDPMKTSSPGSVRKPTNLSFAQVIHSLGTTLYESVTGRVWVDPTTIPAPPPRRGRPRTVKPKLPVGLSERVDQAVRRATDPDPAKRPVSCAEWLKLLRPRSRTVAPRPDVRPDTSDADDRRAYVRYSVGVGSSCIINSSLFDTPLHGDSPEQAAVWPLVVRDVSAGGIGILLARRCEPGTELAVELVTGGNRVTRSLPVRVVRVRKDTLGHWVHGCEFLAPLDEQELATVFSHLGRSDYA
jgi:serine/threonine protein kinase